MHQSGGLMLVPGWTGTTPYVSLRETAIEFLLGCQEESFLSMDKRDFFIFPLYRFASFRYNKLNYANFTK